MNRTNSKNNQLRREREERRAKRLGMKTRTQSEKQRQDENFKRLNPEE